MCVVGLPVARYVYRLGTGEASSGIGTIGQRADLISPRFLVQFQDARPQVDSVMVASESPKFVVQVQVLVGLLCPSNRMEQVSGLEPEFCGFNSHLGYLWGRSSIGRAPALQAGGRGIVTLRLHFNIGSDPRRPGSGLQNRCQWVQLPPEPL